VGSLDGVWSVRRTGGALPPLYRMRKEIAGDRGVTRIGSLPGGFPFRVDGLALRYRFPPGLVDHLEGDGDSYRGRATLLGRELGCFEMRRV
jgi:hypothetical protein